MMLSAGWIAAGIPQLELELETALENPILLVALPVKKATELVARKARTTHVHTTVASFSHSHSCSQANTLAIIHMHEDISVCSGRAIWCKVVGRLHVTTIQSKKRNRFEQERASRLAHVHWSLRYQARLSDPRYEEMILPDVTENPMYSTDDVWDGAVTDELDDI
jgi:hypothetical protein